jgi:hypothetical protein
MTEEEYEALHKALVAANKVLPGEKYCDKTEADFRKKIRKLEKAVLKRQKESGDAREEIEWSKSKELRYTPQGGLCFGSPPHTS